MAELIEDRAESAQLPFGTCARRLGADAAAELFDGLRAGDPFALAMRLCGVGSDACSDLANAIRTARSIVRGSS